MAANTGFFKGKTIVISGASRGIGLAIGKKLAKDGANIAIFAKTAEINPKLPGTIYSAAKEIEEVGGKCLPVQCDIRDEQNVLAAVDETVKKFGGIDVSWSLSLISFWGLDFDQQCQCSVSNFNSVNRHETLWLDARRQYTRNIFDVWIWFILHGLYFAGRSRVFRIWEKLPIRTFSTCLHRYWWSHNGFLHTWRIPWQSSECPCVCLAWVKSCVTTKSLSTLFGQRRWSGRRLWRFFKRKLFYSCLRLLLLDQMLKKDAVNQRLLLMLRTSCWVNLPASTLATLQSTTKCSLRLESGTSTNMHVIQVIILFIGLSKKFVAFCGVFLKI